MARIIMIIMMMMMMMIMLIMIMMRLDKLLCTGVKLGPLVDAFGKLKTRILSQMFIVMMVMNHH